MIPFNIPMLISIIFVLGFQLILYFDVVLGKDARKNNRVTYLAAFTVISIVYLVFNVNDVVSSLLGILLVYCMAEGYRAELKQKIMFTVLYVVLMSLVNMISIYVFYSLNAEQFINYKPIGLSATAKSLLLSGIIMLIILQLMKLVIKRQAQTLPYRYYLLLLFIPVMSIYIVNVLAEYGERNTHFFISMLGLLLLNVFVIYIFEAITEKLRTKQENIRLHDQMEYQDANYEKTVHSFKSIKKIIHDTNQHLLFIEACIKRNEPTAALEHIKLILDKVEDQYHQVNTENILIDALVTNALNIGVAHGIRMKTSFSLYSPQLKIERYDLCIVLGNMLDNALEASRKVRSVEDRDIFIRIYSDEKALYIHIQNQTEHEVLELNTQKSNEEFHGIGLTNIANICDKYGGNMAIDIKNKRFHNMVFLPFRD